MSCGPGGWRQALQDLALVSLFSSRESAAFAMSASSAARSGVISDVSDAAWACGALVVDSVVPLGGWMGSEDSGMVIELLVYGFWVCGKLARLTWPYLFKASCALSVQDWE